MATEEISQEDVQVDVGGGAGEAEERRKAMWFEENVTANFGLKMSMKRILFQVVRVADRTPSAVAPAAPRRHPDAPTHAIQTRARRSSKLWTSSRRTSSARPS